MPDLTPRQMLIEAVKEACAHEAEIWDSEPLSGKSIAECIRTLDLSALPAPEGDDANVSVKRLTHILESAAANTDTDWRWQAAAALRRHPQWETGVIAIDAIPGTEGDDARDAARYRARRDLEWDVMRQFNRKWSKETWEIHYDSQSDAARTKP